MKARFAIAVVALLLWPSAGATAQTLEAPTQPKVNLTLEQRHVIKEIIKDLKVPPAPANQTITIGAEVAQTVMLQPMPADVSAKVPQIRSHLFFKKDDKVVLVEAKDRKIVDVIE
jgi:Protein of unknown function (DUF1236)